MTQWAVLRQVVVATASHDADVRAVRTAFGLGDGFADPELKKLDLVDATMPVSAADKRYLEFVAPVAASGPVASWLAKAGPRGGFTLSVQHPDPDGVRERCQARGVRVPIDDIAFGRTVLQLHPKDVGLLLEIDGIPERAEWFWDDIDPGAEPDSLVDEIVGVEIAVADPGAMAALWVELLDVPQPTEPTVLDLGGATVTFVPGGPSPDWTIVLRRRAGVTDIAGPDLPGITFRLV